MKNFLKKKIPIKEKENMIDEKKYIYFIKEFVPYKTGLLNIIPLNKFTHEN